MAEASGPDLVSVVSLLAAGVVAVPLFKRLGLGSVLGYLAAGLVIGPYGLGLFADPETILHTAELGVVLFLFIIGLEMQPRRLWGMRGEILGLGLVQVLLCMLLLSTVGLVLGYTWQTALIAGTGFVLTSTAIVMQLLEERRMMNRPDGRRIVSILLLEDLAIVPLLALVAFLAPIAEAVPLSERLLAVAIGLFAIAALVAAGRWLLDPMFRVLAAARAREVLTAAALLVVLGAALLMQLSGLSMAMGAFLAGVLLSTSAYRHQLEADVEPFRGILLGLFFLSVGMSLDLGVIAENLGLVVFSVFAFLALKAIGIYVVARLMHAPPAEALERTVLMAQGGEFAFVLYAAALAVGLLTPDDSAVLVAIIIVSMALTPIFVILHDRYAPKAAVSMDGIEHAAGLSASVLIIGFGRMGQIVSQTLLSRGCSISLIDNDAELIRGAREFGFRVFFGDASRLDILHAAGAPNAAAVIVCIDDKAAAERILAIAKAEFPLVPILMRAYDREHAIALVKGGADFQIREVLESALVLGSEALARLGVTPEERSAIIEDVRARDVERLDLQITGGIMAGRTLLLGNLEDLAERRKGA